MLIFSRACVDRHKIEMRKMIIPTHYISLAAGSTLTSRNNLPLSEKIKPSYNKNTNSTNSSGNSKNSSNSNKSSKRKSKHKSNASNSSHDRSDLSGSYNTANALLKTQPFLYQSVATPDIQPPIPKLAHGLDKVLFK